MFERQQKVNAIERDNDLIMQKLIKINNRKPHSMSTPNLPLPRLQKKYNVPFYEEENNHIAKKIINTKASISTVDIAKKWRTQ